MPSGLMSPQPSAARLTDTTVDSGTGAPTWRGPQTRCPSLTASPYKELFSVATTTMSPTTSGRAWTIPSRVGDCHAGFGRADAAGAAAPVAPTEVPTVTSTAKSRAARRRFGPTLGTGCRDRLRHRGRRSAFLDLDAGQETVEPAREPPVGVPEELHRRRHQHHADHRRFDEHRDRKTKPEHLHRRLGAGDETEEHADHDQRR